MKVEYRREFNRNTKYKYTKQEAINYILSKKPGTTIRYEELGKIFGLAVTDELELHKLKDTIGRLKPILVEYGCVIKTIVHVGYYILKPKQISGHCYHTYIRKTLNLLQRSDNILRHIDLKELSDIRMNEYNEVSILN